jgi:hypothetical protein
MGAQQDEGDEEIAAFHVGSVWQGFSNFIISAAEWPSRSSLAMSRTGRLGEDLEGDGSLGQYPECRFGFAFAVEEQRPGDVRRNTLSINSIINFIWR